MHHTCGIYHTVLISSWPAETKKTPLLSGYAPLEKRGWISYYGRFFPSALVASLNRINDYLVRWLVQKYKRFRGRWMRARDALGNHASVYPGLFAHWKLIKP